MEFKRAIKNTFFYHFFAVIVIVVVISDLFEFYFSVNRIIFTAYFRSFCWESKLTIKNKKSYEENIINFWFFVVPAILVRRFLCTNWIDGNGRKTKKKIKTKKEFNRTIGNYVKFCVSHQKCQSLNRLLFFDHIIDACTFPLPPNPRNVKKRELMAKQQQQLKKEQYTDDKHTANTVWKNYKYPCSFIYTLKKWYIRAYLMIAFLLYVWQQPQSHINLQSIRCCVLVLPSNWN